MEEREYQDEVFGGLDPEVIDPVNEMPFSKESRLRAGEIQEIESPLFDDPRLRPISMEKPPSGQFTKKLIPELSERWPLRPEEFHYDKRTFEPVENKDLSSSITVVPGSDLDQATKEEDKIQEVEGN